MAAAAVSDRGLRRKLAQEAARDPERPPARDPERPPERPPARRPAKRRAGPAPEPNNNRAKRARVAPAGDGKRDLLAAYQPWVVRTYGDLAKTKTVTLRKYARILRALRGEECNGSDSSKFRFWVKAKGFHLGKPPGYDAKPADGIVCRYSVLDAEDGQEAIERCSGSGADPALYIPTVPVKNATCHEPVYRKVAVVENFFDLIYTVHVDLEGRAGKHAGQKRTYRTITETYAFLPREAVTRFLMGCTDCQRRPRSMSPASVLPTPSPSPTPLPSTIIPNGYHHLAPISTKLADLHHLLKNGVRDINTKNWESEIDASQHSVKVRFNDGIASFETSEEARQRSFITADPEVYSPTNGVDLSAKNSHIEYNGLSSLVSSPAANNLCHFDSGVSAFRSVRRSSSDVSKSESIDLSVDAASSSRAPDEPAEKSPFKNTKDEKTSQRRHSKSEKKTQPESETALPIKIEKNCEEPSKAKHKKEIVEKQSPKPYNPLDVCNLTSKDPPRSRSSLKKRHLNPMFNEYKSDVDCKSFPKPWSPSPKSMFSPHRLCSESTGLRSSTQLLDPEIDFSVPITTTYLKHMRSLGYSPEESLKLERKEESADITDDDQFSGFQLKEADKVRLMLYAWNVHAQKKGRNGDTADGGGDTNMAELWASYHSALGLAGARRPRDQPSPVLLGAGSADPGGAHDETSSSAGNGKEDDDALGSDDESDERLDPHQHDPERLKAFNMFVRLFVDENLDRIVPISKQPKEKIQAIIDSCARQFPECAERARKRIRTYLKSCRRNKKVRGEAPAAPGAAAPAWDAAIRPTPAHLTSVQAEQILAQACENESHNAKRMRLGLEPVSQPMPTSSSNISIDTTASSTVTHPLLGLYNSTVAMAGGVGGTGGKGLADAGLLGPALAGLDNGLCLNNNNINSKMDASKNNSSRTSTPLASAAVTDFTQSLASSSPALHFGHGLGGPGSANALLSTLGAVAGLHAPVAPVSGAAATNAAVAAYQNALFSAAMAAGHHGPGLNFGGLGAALTGNGPTDLSMKNAATATSLSQSVFPSALTSSSAASALGLGAASSQHSGSKPLLLSHKLSGAEMAAVRQLITGYRESAAFLLRSADELETLLLQQP